ncbi:hypothetical protein [Streptomyces sp. NPDC088775]|uniref:hypothetical protein n=1 Tax=Streptomyces sp. NPDC088775 TaxID=3365896 RepID=UPI0037F5D730
MSHRSITAPLEYAVEVFDARSGATIAFRTITTTPEGFVPLAKQLCDVLAGDTDAYDYALISTREKNCAPVIQMAAS